MIAMLIGIAHGLPIFLVGTISKSHSAVIVTTIIMVGIAFAIGNPAFVGTDLAWITVGCWLGWPSSR